MLSGCIFFLGLFCSYDYVQFCSPIVFLFFLFACLFVCLLNPLYALCLLSDVDECLRSPCEQICNNNPGGYKCGCRKGYNKHRSNDHRCTGIKCANNIFLFAYIVTRASDNSQTINEIKAVQKLNQQVLQEMSSSAILVVSCLYVSLRSVPVTNWQIGIQFEICPRNIAFIQASMHTCSLQRIQEFFFKIPQIVVQAQNSQHSAFLSWPIISPRGRILICIYFDLRCRRDIQEQ